MKKTKIVCTLGPSSETKEVLTQLISSGMNVARLNFSHGSYTEHKKKMDLVKEISEDLQTPTAILLDTKGPEIRIKQFQDKRITLKSGDEFVLTSRDILGNNNEVAVTYKNLPNELEIGNIVLIDDGLIQLKVKDIDNEDIHCVVENGGELSNNKSINLPDVNILLPAITEKDKEDIEFGIQEDIDFIAASFVRKPQDVIEIRKILEDNNASHIQIISKIENREGVNNIDKIIEISDGIMVARGDLGVEISPEEVPLVQKDIIKKCNKVGKPVITATQMLDSMIRNPRPTRAEVTDVANAIFDGTDAIMLSGETAAGKYPIDAVKTMVRIANKTETSDEYKKRIMHNFYGEVTVTNAISHATCTTAEELKASAIITATSSGYTARMVSKFRPLSPVIAITDNEKVVRRLAVVWGVYTIKTTKFKTTDSLFEESVSIAVQSGLLSCGDLVVITAGLPLGVKGSTNLIKIQTIGDIIIRGMGIGKKPVTAIARIIENYDNVFFDKGDILVVKSVDREIMQYAKKASAIVTEEGGLTSQGAIVAMQLEIPVIVGVENATSEIRDGKLITIDPLRGLIYKGKARVL